MASVSGISSPSELLSKYRRAKSPLISGAPRNSATFRVPIRRQLITDRLHYLAAW